MNTLDDETWRVLGLNIETGADVGPQLHIGLAKARLIPRVAPVRMTTDGQGFRPWNQPLGGFWTSPLLDGSTSERAKAIVKLRPETARMFLIGQGWWVLKPRDTARVIKVISPIDVAATYCRFRYNGGAELDFPAMARAGFDGFHVTAEAL